MRLIIIFLLAIFFNGCWFMMKGFTVNYSVINNTHYSLKIIGFDHRINKSADTIFLLPNSRQTFNRYSGEDDDPRTFFSIAGVDSVHVIFNSEKLLILTTGSSKHPILEDVFVAEITNEDYNNAIPIQKD